MFKQIRAWSVGKVFKVHVIKRSRHNTGLGVPFKETDMI